MADWDEIKRLAADFQRTQTTDTLQRISERNCIDIIKKLTDLNLIELIYTCDGREFLTPAHLIKEIEDEIYVNGRRMQLHELASNLKVDYQHIENKAKELAKEKPNEYSVILGQLIHSTYKNTLGQKICDCMLSKGQLSIADFSKTLDLPSEFLLSIVKELLPKVIDDYVVGQDERTYYTTDMMDQYKSIIAGTLSAISRPISIASLMKRLAIPERIFSPIVDSLIKEGRVDAIVDSRVFIPAIYARNQNERVEEFFKSNYYIGYDMLSRWDIKQPKAFLKKKFPSGIQLKTCLISPELLSQVESMIEDTITTNGWIDIGNGSIVPTAIEADDIELLLQEIIKRNKQLKSSCTIFNRTVVCSLGFIATSRNSFNNLMHTKADDHLKQGKLINHFLGGKVKEQQPGDERNKDNVTSTSAEDKDRVKDKDEPSSKAASKDEEKSAPKESATIDDESQQSQKLDRRQERRDRKSKGAETIESDESDEEQGNKKSKGRKSGGGTQGREIKQKAVKKKYIPGNKSNQRGNDMSDDESKVSSKAPRSNKGRAARRALSPERPSTKAPPKGKQSTANQPPKKEPLIFMNTQEIVAKLKMDSPGANEGPDEFLEELARSLENELNESYVLLAKQKLDAFLKSQSEDKHDEQGGEEDDIDLIE